MSARFAEKSLQRQQWVCSVLGGKTDYKEANAGAMLNLGTRYYNGFMGLPMNREKNQIFVK